MIGTFGSLLLQAGLFVLGVYIEKFARSTFSNIENDFLLGMRANGSNKPPG